MKNKKQFFGVLISVFVSVFVVALIVYAVTTISEDVDIDTGKLVAGHDAILEHALQVGHTASAAYSRFGNATTGHGLADDDDVLFVGLVEFDDNVYFDGIASLSDSGTLRVANIVGHTDAGQYLRIGDVAATGHSLDADDDLLVNGDLEVDGTAFFDGVASLSDSGTLRVPIIYGAMDAGQYLSIGNANPTGHALDSEDDLLITGELEVDGTAYFDGIVSISVSTGSLIVPTIYGGMDNNYLRIGDIDTTGHGLGDIEDMLITGDLEVDGTAYFDGTVSVSDANGLEIGGGATIYGATGSPSGNCIIGDIHINSSADSGTNADRVISVCDETNTWSAVDVQ